MHLPGCSKSLEHGSSGSVGEALGRQSEQNPLGICGKEALAIDGLSLQRNPNLWVRAQVSEPDRSRLGAPCKLCDLKGIIKSLSLSSLMCNTEEVMLPKAVVIFK